MRLTPEQRQAVNSTADHLAIVAGAGTGKTTTIVARVQRLLDEGVPPAEICVTTFTRSAAAELQERLQASGYALPTVATVHSLCAAIMRDNPEAAGRSAGFSVYDDIDQEAILRDAARDLALKAAHTARRQTLAKNPRVRATYADRLREANAVDYEQLESLALLALPGGPWAARFGHMLIDEAQDISLAQWELLCGMSRRCITLVADPRQAIYQWRGGDSTVFASFARGAERVQLTANHRSGQHIVHLANAIHPERPALTATGPALVVERDLLDEPVFVARTIASLISKGHAPRSIAVVGRTWRSLFGVAAAIREQGLQVKLVSRDQDRWETPTGRTLARWILLQSNPYDANLAALVARVLQPELDTAERRAHAHRTRKALSTVLASDGSLPNLEPESAMAAAASIVERLPDPALAHELASRLPRWRTIEGFTAWWLFGRTSQDRIVDLPADTVPAMTVHGAKGLEWPTVVVVGSHLFPLSSARDDLAYEEERNCFYVACTRAKERLLITRPRTVETRNSTITTRRSPFLP